MSPNKEISTFGQILTLSVVFAIFSALLIMSGRAYKTTSSQSSLISNLRSTPSVTTSPRTPGPAAERCKNYKPEVTKKEIRDIQITNAGISAKSSADTIKKRKELMLKLADKDPNAFLCNVLKKDRRNSLPSKLGSSIETEVSKEGVLSVIHIDDFKSGKSKFKYRLREGKQDFEFYPDSEVPVLSGTKVKVSGYQLDNAIVAAIDDPTTFQITSTPAPMPTTTTPKIMVLLVTYPDSPPLPFSPEGAENIILDRVNSFYKEASYNKLSYGADAYGWYTIPVNGNELNANNNCYLFLEKYHPQKKTIQEIIQENNIDIAQYQRILILVNYDCSGAVGMGTVGNAEIPVNGINYYMPISWVSYLSSLLYPKTTLTLFEKVTSHELGHNLGVLHANAWECGAGQIINGTNCIHYEYVNHFDIMGNFIFSLHFNAAFKEFFGWLDQTSILNITQPGRYTLNPLESSAGTRGAKINQPGTNKYPFYLEYRKPIGFDSRLNEESRNGLFINWIPDQNWSLYTRLLDMSPHQDSTWPADDWADVTLKADGSVFIDSQRGIKIGPVISATENVITFDVSFSVAPEPAKLSAPKSGALLLPSTTFSWSPVPEATEYWLGVGTPFDSIKASPWGNIYALTTGTNTSATVTGIPNDGSTVYVRLWSLINGNWLFNDYNFQTLKKPVKAEMEYPLPGSVLSSPITSFAWSTGSGVTEYWLGVGTSFNSISTEPWGDIYAKSTNLDTRVKVSGIPTNGALIYVRLWSKINGSWVSNDYTYITDNPSDIISPAPDSQLSPTTTFSWTTGTESEYWLGVGTSFDSVNTSPWGDIYAKSTGLNSSVTVSNIPTDKVVYVRLWYVANNKWVYKDYQYNT